MASQMMAAINISDGEQSPKQTPNIAGTGGGQPDQAQEEQPEEPVESRMPEARGAKDGRAGVGKAKTNRNGDG